MARSLITQVSDNAFDKFQARQHVGAKMPSHAEKIAFSLQVRSQPTPTEEEVRSRIEKRIRGLDNILAFLRSNLVELEKLPQQVRLKQLRTMTLVLAAVDEFMDSTPSIQGVASPIRRARNELVSLKEAIYLETPVEKDVFEFETYREAISTIEGLKAKSQERLNKAKQADPSDLTETEEKVLSDNAAFKLKFPKAGSFIVTRAPIIPLLTVSADRLSQAGFRAESAGGYPIIHNQMVIGLSRELIAREGKRRPIDIADDIRRQVQKKIHHPVKFVVERAGTGRNLRGTWFWIMLDSDLDHLAMVSPGKVVKIPSWGFTI